MSVPGLYHHVGGKDDLLRLTAEYSAAHLELPATATSTGRFGCSSGRSTTGTPSWANPSS